jgi:hypothetical protein
MPKARGKSELLQGTLDMLILKALQFEPMHGFGLPAGSDWPRSWSNGRWFRARSTRC